MKIGLSTAAFYGKWEVEEAAALLGRYGAECAEVFLQTRSEYTREFARLVRKNLNGVPCTSVHPFGTAFENEFFARSTRQRADATGYVSTCAGCGGGTWRAFVCISWQVFSGAD